MKVYVAVLIPYGTLRYECGEDIIGVFKDKNVAIQTSYNEEVEYFITNENYVVNLNETVDFLEGKSNNLQVWHDRYENYDCYYEIVIYEREVV